MDDDMNEGKPAVTTGDIAGAFPSLGEAYAFIQPAYDLMVSRFESANGRLAAMLSMTSAVAVGAPVLAATALGADKLRTWPFLISLTLWGLALVAGVIGLNVGKVKIIHPGNLRKEFVFLDPAKFQVELMNHAADDFDTNLKAIDYKHALGVGASILFSLASLVFGFGIAR